MRGVAIVIVIQDGLGLSVPIFVALGHEIALAYAVEVLECFLWFVSQEAQSLVVCNRLNVITVIKREDVQLAVLNSCAGLREQRLGLGEIGECDGRFLVNIVHKACIAGGEAIEYIGDDLGGGHLLILL